jgi:hypothetical protein
MLIGILSSLSFLKDDFYTFHAFTLCLVLLSNKRKLNLIRRLFDPFDRTIIEQLSNNDRIRSDLRSLETRRRYRDEPYRV